MSIADNVTIIRDGQTIETLENKNISEERIIKGMVGRELTNRYPVRKPNIGEVVFEVKDWNVTHPIYRDRKVVEDVSFNVKRGEIVGIAGLMGAGRTELAMSLFGKAYGDNIQGQIYKNGEKIEYNGTANMIKEIPIMQPLFV